jgi:hypothetical protein
MPERRPSRPIESRIAVTGRAPAGPGRAQPGEIFEAAKIYAAGLFTLQCHYASWTGMGLLDSELHRTRATRGASPGERRVRVVDRLGRRPADEERVAQFVERPITGRSINSLQLTKIL